MTAPVRRGTTNRNVRGSSYDRAARRAWVLVTFGDGRTCPCYRCGTVLNSETLTVDRIIPGVRGGRYDRKNIRPACGRCNSETGGALNGQRPAKAAALPDVACANCGHCRLYWCAGRIVCLFCQLTTQERYAVLQAVGAATGEVPR